MSADGKPSVWVMMPWAERNTYQSSLGAEIEALGYRVVYRRRRGFLPLGGVGKEWAGGRRVLHLHWIEELANGRRRWMVTVRWLLLWVQVWWMRRRGVMVLWTGHNLEPHEGFGLPGQRWFYRRVIRQADGVMVHCRAAGKLIVERWGLPRDRMLVVPHPLFAGDYPAASSRGEARERLGLAGADRVVVHVGMLKAYKNLGELIRVFGASTVAGVNDRLVIAGMSLDPALTAELEALAERDPRVRVDPGFLSPESLVDYVSASDVVALPYRATLTSGVAMLAATYGRPVIGPGEGCMSEMMGGHGFEYSLAEERGLVRALDEALACDDLGGMGERFAEHNAAATWERMAGVLVDWAEGSAAGSSG